MIARKTLAVFSFWMTLVAFGVWAGWLLTPVRAVSLNGASPARSDGDEDHATYGRQHDPADQELSLPPQQYRRHISFQNFRRVSNSGFRRQLRFQRVYFDPPFSCDHVPPSEQYSQPQILDTYPRLEARTLPPLISRLNRIDFCACGFSENASLLLSLESPHGDVVLPPQPVAVEETRLGFPADDSAVNYCYEPLRFRTFDFTPEDSYGRYTIKIVDGNTTLEQPFDLMRSEYPLLYRSARMEGYMLAGFEPFETVEIVAYELADRGYSEETWDYEAVGELELDQDGVGIVTDVGSDFAIFVLGEQGVVYEDLTEYGGDIYIESPLESYNLTEAQDYFYHAEGRDYDDNQGQIADYTKAIELDPAYHPAYFQLGELYYQEGRIDEALASYSKAIEIDPDYVSARYKRAQIYRAQLNFEAAIGDYSKIIELAPDSMLYYERAYFERGVVYLERNEAGDAQRALADFEHYLASGLGTEKDLRLRAENARLVATERLEQMKITPILPDPAIDCVNLLRNGTMENDEGWIVDLGGRSAQYSDEAHNDQRGLVAGLPGGTTPYRPVWSSARQRVDLPAQGTPLLSYWYRAETDAFPGRDLQIVALLDQAGWVLKMLQIGLENNQAWQEAETFDLSAYAGQTVYIYFGVFNDGFGGATRLLIDDVSVCAE